MLKSLLLCSSLALSLTQPATCHAAAPDPWAGDVQTVAVGNNDLGVSLFRGLVKWRQGNLVMSPAAVSIGLALVYGGARSRTSEQMQRVLGLSLPPRRVHPSLKQWLRRMTKGNGTRGFRVEFDNRIVPITTEADPARTRFDLRTGLEYEGRWTIPFRRHRTAPLTFRREGAAPVQVTGMTRTFWSRHARVDGVELAELHFGWYWNQSMVILRPIAGDTPLRDIEAKLSPATLKEWLGALRRAKIELTLPSFNIHSKTALREPLRALGIRDAFDSERASFLPMLGHRGVALGQFSHEARVEFDERGTQARRATAVGLPVTNADRVPATPVRMDRPFLFLVRDARSGGLLLLGRVSDPSV